MSAQRLLLGQLAALNDALARRGARPDLTVREAEACEPATIARAIDLAEHRLSLLMALTEKGMSK